MKNALSLLAVITVSGLIFWFGALFGQDRADLNRLSFETAMLINEINFNSNRPVNSPAISCAHPQS